MIDSGVLPIISLASKPIARILLSCSETATTEGSLSTIPLPGRNTKVLAVPKSMPSFLEKIPIGVIYHPVVDFGNAQSAFKNLAKIHYRVHTNMLKLKI